MKPWNRLLLPALLAFALPGALLAQPTHDPMIGTWVLNVSKSTFKPASTAPQSETRTLEATPDGMYQLTVHRVGTDGTARTETSTFKVDGKSYALTGNPAVDTVKVTRVNARATHSILMLHGKAIGRYNVNVSKDGKSATATIIIPHASGQTDRSVWVYDRQ